MKQGFPKWDDNALFGLFEIVKIKQMGIFEISGTNIIFLLAILLTLVVDP